MTISSTATRKAGPYAGNGSTVAFAFTFKVFADSDLVVTHTDDNGLETVKTLTTHYTATLNANQNSNPGGTVTMLTAPATGEKLTITSAVPKTQAVNLSDGGGFFASVVNNALDRLTIFSQELAERLGRAMSLPVSVDAGVSAELPTPEAGTLIGWNADGDGLENKVASDLSLVTVSSYIGTLIDDGTAAEARQTLGGFVQRAHATDTTQRTITASIPYDSTAPQNTEGTELVSCSITPKNVANRLVITATIPQASLAVTDEFSTVTAIAALFYGGSASALAAGVILSQGPSSQAKHGTITLVHEMAAGSTSALTFSVRAGTVSTSSAASLYINQQTLGGKSFVTLCIDEYCS